MFDDSDVAATEGNRSPLEQAQSWLFPPLPLPVGSSVFQDLHAFKCESYPYNDLMFESSEWQFFIQRRYVCCRKRSVEMEKLGRLRGPSEERVLNTSRSLKPKIRKH